VLCDGNLQTAHLSPIFARILETEHIHEDLTWVLMTRPIVAPKTLWREFRRDQRRGDFVREVFILACLESAGQDIRPNLADLAVSRSLTEAERNQAGALLAVLVKNGHLHFTDVQDLAHPAEPEVPIAVRKRK